jgi:hypothetical protein
MYLCIVYIIYIYDIYLMYVYRSEKVVVEEEALASIGERCKSEQESIETEVAGVPKP